MWMSARWHRPRRSGPDVARIVGISGSNPRVENLPAAPPRFARHLKGAAHRRRGDERPWVAVARVAGVDEIRHEWGDPAAEEFLRSVASAMRASLRESDKLSPVGRAEYGIIIDAPSADDVMAGLERLIRNVAELAERDRRWTGGSLCVGVTPLESQDAAATLSRAREALDRAERQGGTRVAMAGASG
jgi:GGDEF domain-containing protein